MGKILTIVVLIFGFNSAYTYASERATCKIISYGPTLGIGSGTFISKQDNKYQILTCGHVIRGAVFLTIELFKDGVRSVPVPAKIKYFSLSPNLSNDDLAILEIDERDLRGYIPELIELSLEPVSNNDKVYGFGFPGGRWIQEWNGYIHSTNNGNVYTTMIPTPGQSGSAILKVINGKPKIVGMILWTFHDRGGGSSTSTIIELLK